MHRGAAVYEQDNTSELRRLFGAGGVVSLAGDYVVSGTVFVRSGTVFDGSGARIRLAAGAKCSIFANRYRQNICQSVAGLTISGGFFTMPETGHDWDVGDVVYVEGFLGNSALNGPKTVESVVPGVSWTFAATGSNPTNTALQRVATSLYNPLPGSSFVRASNVVTVTEVGHTKHVGDQPYIAGLSGANSFNGVQIVTATTATTWTYANTGVDETATGTAQVLFDADIALRNIDLDWDKDNQSTGDQTQSYVVWLGNVSRSEVSGVVRRNNGRSVQCFNVSGCDFPALHTEVGRVGIQFDGFCRNNWCGRVTGFGQTDDALAIGITGNMGLVNSYTANPNMLAYNAAQVEGSWVAGTGDNGDFSIDYIRSDSPTGLLKLYGTTGARIGSVIVGATFGQGKCTIGDTNQNDVGGTGKTGLTVGLLRVDMLANRQNVATPKSVTLNAGIKNIEVFEINGARIDSSGTNGNAIEIDACPIDRMALRNIQSKTGQNGAFLAVKNSSAIGVLQIESSRFEGNDGTNYYGLAVLQSGGATIGTAQWGRVKAKNLRALHECNGASSQTVHQIGDVDLDHCANGWMANAAHTMVCMARGVVETTTLTGIFSLSTSAASVLRLIGGALSHAANKLIGNQSSGTGTFSIKVPDGSAQVDGVAATAFAPVAGDEFWNTNAAFGTGIGKYGRTSAGAWQKLF